MWIDARGVAAVSPGSRRSLEVNQVWLYALFIVMVSVVGLIAMAAAPQAATSSRRDRRRLRGNSPIVLYSLL
jgi:hypothetical protein